MTRASDLARLLGAGATINDGTTITTDDNTVQLSLISTDADANSGPELDLYRNSSSPADADLMGKVTFRGRNDNSQDVNYGQIVARAEDASDGTEDGRVDFRAIIGGTEGTFMKYHVPSGNEVVFNDGSLDIDFRVESNGNANMLFVDGGNDSVIIGHNDGTNGTFLSQAAFQVVGTNAVSAHIGLSRSSDNAHPCTLSFTKSRGAVGTDTVVQDNDEIGQILFAAGDGTDLSSQAANIKVAIDGTPGANDVPSRMTFGTTADGANSPTERFRLTSAGDLLIGKTSTGIATAGHRISSAAATFVRDGGGALLVNRLSDDGNLIELYGQSSVVGMIGAVSSSLYIASPSGSETGLRFSNDVVHPCNSDGAPRDNAIDLGYSSGRFDDIFATNSTIQTSDRNEKQDIEELSDAEKRVAVVAKGLMRKFRWKDKVEEKGDKARTHFGIIAQDLQDAFTAESLDATKYAMFCSDTWWEKEITVDAVEAKDAVYKEVTDSDGLKTNNLVSNAVEARDAYTYTDIKQEATEGYAEKTRLGVRYSELLAFIISAL